MRHAQFANVLLPIALPQVFSYEIPGELANTIAVGQRAIVQFGHRKIVSGLVWEIHQNKPDYEVKAILEKYPSDLNSLQTVGYQEIIAYFNRKHDKQEAINLIKRNSRRYAKRQMTWFKKEKRIH